MRDADEIIDRLFIIATVILVIAVALVASGCDQVTRITITGPLAVATSEDKGKPVPPTAAPAVPSGPVNQNQVVIVDVVPGETPLIGRVPPTPDPVPFNPPVVPVPAPATPPATPPVSSDTCDKPGRGDGNGTPGNGKGQGDDNGKSCR